MEHHGAGAVADGTNTAFSNTILVMSTNTTEIKSLSLSCKGITKLFAGVNPIVSLIMMHTNASMGSILFKAFFGFDGGIGTKRNKVLNVDITRCFIHKENAPSVLF